MSNEPTPADEGPVLNWFLYTMALTLGIPTVMDGLALGSSRVLIVGIALSAGLFGLAIWRDWRAEIRRDETKKRPRPAASAW